MTHHPEDLLDDGDIKDKLLAPLETELGKLNFWLFFSFFLLLIFGIFGTIICATLFLSAYDWASITFVLGMLAAFITTFPMAYTHFKYAQNCKTFCSEASHENFDKLLRSSVSDWRLLAFAFIFVASVSIPVAVIASYEDWQRTSYAKEVPPELPEINITPPTIDEAPVENTEPIEEDLAPESE